MTTTNKPQTISPRMLFRSFAIAEMFTWAGLITALVLRAFDVATLVPIAGGIHGFVFLCYSAARQDLAGKIHADFDLFMANETKELARLTSERDRLDDERMTLLQAHYASALPIDQLKQE